MITFKEDIIPTEEDIIKLYNDANWTAYTKDKKTLMNALKNSLCLITAWDNNQLVGLIRVIGDNHTIIYIQDILVLKSHKKQKIGTALVNKVLSKYKHIRQNVLLTDDNPETRGFYESLGFESCDKGQLVSFFKMNQ